MLGGVYVDSWDDNMLGCAVTFILYKFAHLQWIVLTLNPDHRHDGCPRTSMTRTARRPLLLLIFTTMQSVLVQGATKMMSARQRTAARRREDRATGSGRLLCRLPSSRPRWHLGVGA